MHPPYRAFLESLPPRLYLSTVYWNGGTGNWDYTSLNWNTAANGTGTQVAWVNGDDAVFNANAYATVALADNISPNSITVTAGTVTISAPDGADFYNATTFDWTGGNLTTIGLEFDGAAVTLDGHSGTFNFESSSFQNGGLTWSSGNVNVTSGGTFEYDDILLEGGSNTFTLDGGSIGASGVTVSWNSGNLNFTDGSSLTIYYGYMTLDAPSNTLTFNNSTLETDSSSVSWDAGNLALLNGSTFIQSTGPFDIPAASTLTVDDLGYLSNFNNTGTVALKCDIDLSGTTLSGGNDEITSGYTATISSTFTVNTGSLIIDSGATLDWSGGNLSIGTSGTVENHGTFTITTTGDITGTVGVDGLQDFSSLRSQVLSEMTSLLTGVTAPDFTGTGPPYTWQESVNMMNTDGSRNTDGWWGDLDLTAIPVNNPEVTGILITPRDMIFAAHSGANIGDVYTFMDNDGNTYTRTVESVQVAYGDILVATLGDADGNADDLPSSIHPVKLMPTNFENQYVYDLSAGLPVAFTNQDRTLLVGNYASDLYYLSQQQVEVTQSSAALFSPFYYDVRLHDSGSPVMMAVHGELVLITNWYTSVTGPNDGYYIDDINDAIGWNAWHLGVLGKTGYSSPITVTTADMSGFTDYTALH